MKKEWHLVMNSQGEAIAVFCHLVPALAFSRALQQELGLAKRPSTVIASKETRPAHLTATGIGVPPSWFAVLWSPGVLEAAFLHEPHARGWHELHTQGACYLVRGNSVLVAAFEEETKETVEPFRAPDPPQEVVLASWYVTRIARYLGGGVPHAKDREQLLAGPFQVWEQAARWLQACRDAEIAVDPYAGFEAFGVRQLSNQTTERGKWMDAIEKTQAAEVA